MNTACDTLRRWGFLGMMMCGWAIPAFSFPSWIGVYGDFQRHDGHNPGVFTVLMNQDYYGLNSDVGIQVDGGSWNVYAMTYSGNVDGNSKWTVNLGEAFPADSEVEYYFHGWDNWGGNIWDNNGGSNYSFEAGPAELFWIGNVTQTPTNGAITPQADLWVNIQSWPRSAVTMGGVLYTSTKGLIWNEVPLEWEGLSGANDLWQANLGKFGWNKDIQYSIFLTDGWGALWDNNDGLNHRAKVNTDPSLDYWGDFDGDGIPNGVEYQLGYDPTDPRDGLRDSDDDGIPDGEEYQLGTDMFKADTDGDGVPDFEEVYGFLTSPTVSNAHSFVTAYTVDVTDVNSSVGDWVVTNGAIRSTGIRGHLAYEVSLTSADIYRIKLGCTGVIAPASLRLKLNGIPLLRDAWLAPDDLDSWDEWVGPDFEDDHFVPTFFTMFLPSGTHTLEIEWDNTYKIHTFQINELVFERIPGVDSNNDGMKDWVERVLLARNAASLAPATSVISPAFIEGIAHYVDAMEINDGDIPVRYGARGWYANVPLETNALTSVDISFENGGLVEDFDIEWVPLNLLMAENMTVRKGDSIQLMADDASGAEGDVLISVNGTPAYELTQGEVTIHPFDVAGEVILTAELEYGEELVSHSITCMVVEATFPLEAPICGLGRAREWECPDVGANATIVADPALFLEDATALTNGGFRFMLATDRYRERYIEARAGGENGPILDSTPVFGVAAHGGDKTWVHSIDVLNDGSQLYIIGIITTRIDPALTIRVMAVGGGVTFDDGLLEKTFEMEDFDATGVLNIYFVKSSTVTAPCHDIEIYQDGVLIAN